MNSSYIHIRVQQRNGKKSITTIQGLTSYLNEVEMKDLQRLLQRQLNTNGAIIEHKEFGEILQLQGDKRQEVYNFIVQHNIADKNDIKIHGF